MPQLETRDPAPTREQILSDYAALERQRMRRIEDDAACFKTVVAYLNSVRINLDNGHPFTVEEVLRTACSLIEQDRPNAFAHSPETLVDHVTRLAGR